MLKEIHGISEVRTVGNGDKPYTHRILVMDNGDEVILRATSFADTGLSPAQARQLAQFLREAADRAESAANGAATKLTEIGLNVSEGDVL